MPLNVWKNGEKIIPNWFHLIQKSMCEITSYLVCYSWEPLRIKLGYLFPSKFISKIPYIVVIKPKPTYTHTHKIVLGMEIWNWVAYSNPRTNPHVYIVVAWKLTRGSWCIPQLSPLLLLLSLLLACPLQTSLNL